MEQKIIFAVVGFLLSILFIRWANNYNDSGFISFGDLNRLLILLAGGLPITLLVLGFFSIFAKLFSVEAKLYGKIIMWAMRLTVIFQWVIWSQLIALLFQNL